MDELLLLARFENQRQTLKLENVHLNGLILELVSRNTSALKEKKITCNTNFSKDFYTQTDSYLCSIIINNLITNAIKYSKKEAILSIDIAETETNLICTITDNGIGISEEDLQKIFEQFYRSKSGEHPEIKGTGLGLSIVKRLCTLLDIEIKIESVENIGTKVMLHFNK